MKIAIIGEQNTKGGGSYHQSLKTYKLLSSIEEFKFCFLNINSKITSKEKNILKKGQKLIFPLPDIEII